MCYLGFKMCEKVTSAEWLPYLTILFHHQCYYFITFITEIEIITIILLLLLCSNLLNYYLIIFSQVLETL